MSKRRTRRLGSIAGSAIVAAVLLTAAPARASSDDGVEKNAVLRSGDFPAGWEKTTRRAPTASGIDDCAGIDGVTAVLARKETRSPQFVRPDTDDVMAGNSVVVLKSPKQAKGYLAPYRDPDAVRCLEALTESRLSGRGFTAVGVYVTPTDRVPSGADDAAGFGVEITVTAPPTVGQAAQTAVLYEDLLVVRVGRALATFAFLNPVRPLPEEGELVDAVVGRLEDGLGR